MMVEASPRPWRPEPIRPRRMRSLAPSTREAEAAVRTAVFIKLRRVLSGFIWLKYSAYNLRAHGSSLISVDGAVRAHQTAAPDGAGAVPRRRFLRVVLRRRGHRRARHLAHADLASKGSGRAHPDGRRPLPCGAGIHQQAAAKGISRGDLRANGRSREDQETREARS